MLCVKFTPSSSFDQFNELISALDETVDSFGMYKYQHVYDTYLVSCPRGALPDIDEDHEPYPEDYTIQMVLLAFRIKEVVETFYTHSGERLSVQAGLNCGPAAGAVVGLSRKFYCIYGAFYCIYGS
ncbi:nucleotide cyclase [Baffinella frigidus]|nr:nucleotide cyclase [Cryptophyta sp. CCMP2293]